METIFSTMTLVGGRWKFEIEFLRLVKAILYRRFIFHIIVYGSYGDDILDHDVGGGQAGSQQVRHHVDDLLVQLWKP